MSYSRASFINGIAFAIGTGNATITDASAGISWSTIPDGSTVHYGI